MTCHWCAKEPKAGYSYCAKHLKRARDSSRRFYSRARELGHCYHCTKCARHPKAEADYRRQSRAAEAQ